MKPGISIQGPVQAGPARAACERVLRALPDWFGVEESIVGYIQSAGELPTWLALDGDEPVGFITVKQHFPRSAEVYVMGILEEYHGRGIGRGLVSVVEGWLACQGVEYLQVKTLSASRPDPYYARTRAFYTALGFCPLEELKLFWDEATPCLLLVKRL